MKITTLRIERKKMRWTLAYVAEQLGITNQAVNLLETAQNKPSYDVLIKALKLFDKEALAQEVEQLFAVVDDKSNLSK